MTYPKIPFTIRNQTGVLCPYTIRGPRLVCNYRGRCFLEDAQFLSKIEFYLYISRLRGQNWEHSGKPQNAQDLKKTQLILLEISRWFNGQEQELLLDDYGKHNFKETGRLPMTYQKCRMWRQAYRKFLTWKKERELERIERFVKTVVV